MHESTISISSLACLLLIASCIAVSIDARIHCCSRRGCYRRPCPQQTAGAAAVVVASAADAAIDARLADAVDIVADGVGDGDGVNDGGLWRQRRQQPHAALVGHSSSRSLEDASAFRWCRDAVDSYGWSRSSWCDSVGGRIRKHTGCPTAHACPGSGASGNSSRRRYVGSRDTPGVH